MRVRKIKEDRLCRAILSHREGQPVLKNSIWNFGSYLSLNLWEPWLQRAVVSTLCKPGKVWSENSEDEQTFNVINNMFYIKPKGAQTLLGLLYFGIGISYKLYLSHSNWPIGKY